MILGHYITLFLLCIWISILLFHESLLKMLSFLSFHWKLVENQLTTDVRNYFLSLFFFTELRFFLHKHQIFMFAVLLLLILISGILCSPTIFFIFKSVLENLGFWICIKNVESTYQFLWKMLLIFLQDLYQLYRQVWKNCHFYNSEFSNSLTWSIYPFI